MNGTRLSIRIDLENGDRIGPGKIVLLEAIRDTGSISAGARKIGARGSSSNRSTPRSKDRA
jgi:molybdenum-dependent DNA-binding transcriptional regulator ModE